MTKANRFSSPDSLVLVLAGAVLWGTAGPASQFLYNDTATTPMAVAMLRMTLAAPLLLLIAAKGLRRDFRALRARTPLVLIGGASIALYQVFYFQAVAVSGVTLATLTALCPVPILVAVLARGILGERSTPTPWLGIALASTGTLLLVGAPDTDAHAADLALGAALGLLASLSFAGIALSGRALGDHHPPLAVTATLFTVGGVILLPVLLIQPDGVSAAFRGWPLIAFLVIVPTVLAYGLFYTGVGRTPAALTGVIIVAEPLTASTLGWAMLGETLAPVQLAGALLLCAAMVRAAWQENAPAGRGSQLGGGRD